MEGTGIEQAENASTREGWFTLELKSAALVGLCILLVVGGAAGGYFAGKGSRDDPDAARSATETAALETGTASGASRGYAIGFEQARGTAYDEVFRSSYRRSYRRAFEEAGLRVPASTEIEVSKPE